MKVGIELRIDVTKIDKERIYVGQKGKYLTMTTFVDLDNLDQYDNSGMITHKNREGEDRAPILGNSKVFWKENQQPEQQAPRQQQPSMEQQAGHGNQSPPHDDFRDDSSIPF